MIQNKSHNSNIYPVINVFENDISEFRKTSNEKSQWYEEKAAMKSSGWGSKWLTWPILQQHRHHMSSIGWNSYSPSEGESALRSFLTTLQTYPQSAAKGVHSAPLFAAAPPLCIRISTNKGLLLWHLLHTYPYSPPSASNTWPAWPANN